MTASNDREKYANCMEEIKLRTNSVIDIINRKTTTTYKMTNIEFCCLQIRKILELITMASISAHRDIYNKVYKNFYNHWRVKDILDDLEKLHPDFYPIPTKQIIKDGKVIEVQKIKDGYLTKEDIIEIYSDCSSIIHVRNPYNKNKPDVEKIEYKISIWLDKIINLLNHHQVKLYKSDNQIWVLMNGKDDGRVHVYDMERL